MAVEAPKGALVGSQSTVNEISTKPEKFVCTSICECSFACQQVPPGDSIKSSTWFPILNQQFRTQNRCSPCHRLESASHLQALSGYPTNHVVGCQTSDNRCGHQRIQNHSELFFQLNLIDVYFFICSHVLLHVT